jgi:hypothetical protein
VPLWQARSPSFIGQLAICWSALAKRHFLNSFGGLAMLAAIRRATSLVRRLFTERRCSCGPLGNASASPARVSTTRRYGLGPWTTHEEVFEDELAFASLERGIASAAYDLAIRQRACLGTNKLVLGTAVWAVEAGRFWHHPPLGKGGPEQVAPLALASSPAPPSQLTQRSPMGLLRHPSLRAVGAGIGTR